MPLGKIRETVLYGLSRTHPGHRFTRRRWAVAIVFTAAVAALPLTGVLRFDLWGGRHVVLGEELGLVAAAKAFAFPFLAINIAIVIASRLVGRYLCGFVCPVGAISRLAEWMRWHERRRGHSILGGVLLFLFCFVLAATTFSFWVDWRVFAEGSAAARGISASFLAGTTLLLFFGARRIGLRFCRDVCPSGIYFAVLGTQTTNAIEFANPEACTDCKACERSCPIDLEPREMVGAEPEGSRGLYPDGLTDYALCIRCGDCVKACEATTEEDPAPTPLRMGFLPAGLRAAGSPGDGSPTDGEGTGVESP